MSASGSLRRRAQATSSAPATAAARRRQPARRLARGRPGGALPPAADWPRAGRAVQALVFLPFRVIGRRLVGLKLIQVHLLDGFPCVHCPRPMLTIADGGSAAAQPLTPGHPSICSYLLAKIAHLS